MTAAIALLVLVAPAAVVTGGSAAPGGRLVSRQGDTWFVAARGNATGMTDGGSIQCAPDQAQAYYDLHRTAPRPGVELRASTFHLGETEERRTDADRSPACPRPRQPLLVPGSGHGLLLGPVTFTRDDGRPQTVTEEFTTAGFDGPYVLSLRNGAAGGRMRCTSGEVRLNGELLFGPSDRIWRGSGVQIPVSLLEHSRLEVRLTGSPDGRLTVWIAGNPRLSAQLDEAGVVTEEVPAQGGTLCTGAAKGTSICLTLPEGALPEPRRITLTPITTIANLPLQHGLVAGVDLGPAGLKLLRAATLEVSLPGADPPGSLVAFGYSEGGARFHLRPFQRLSGGMRTSVAHFSGYGFGSATPADIGQIVSTASPDSEESFSNRVTEILTGGPGVITPEMIPELLALLQAWYETVVRPAFVYTLACGGTTGCPAFREMVVAAQTLFASWYAATQLLGLDADPAIQEVERRHREFVEEESQKLMASLEARCLQASGFCVRVAAFKDAEALVEPLQAWGYQWQFDHDQWCDGVARGGVSSVELRPEALQIDQYDKQPIALIAKNHKKEELPQPQELAVIWESGDKGIAVVDYAVDATSAEVFGSEIGTTAVTATATQCENSFSGSARVEVVSPVSWVDVSPQHSSIEVDEEVVVTVVLRNRAGEEVPGGLFPVRFTTVAPMTCPPSNCRVGQVEITPRVDVAGRWNALVHGRKGGYVSVEASVAGRAEPGYFHVIVMAVPTAVELNPLSVTLKPGGRATLTATVHMNDSTDDQYPPYHWEIDWDRSQPKPADLDPPDKFSIVVRALQPGEARVTAEARGPDGTTVRSQPSQITVAGPMPSIDVVPNQVTLWPQETVELQAVVRDAAGDVLPAATVTWTNGGPPDVATVRDAGSQRAVVTALAVGTATIMARIAPPDAPTVLWAPVRIDVEPPCTECQIRLIVEGKEYAWIDVGTWEPCSAKVPGPDDVRLAPGCPVRVRAVSVGGAFGNHVRWASDAGILTDIVSNATESEATLTPSTSGTLTVKLGDRSAQTAVWVSPWTGLYRLDAVLCDPPEHCINPPEIGRIEQFLVEPGTLVIHGIGSWWWRNFPKCPGTSIWLSGNATQWILDDPNYDAWTMGEALTFSASGATWELWDYSHPGVYPPYSHWAREVFSRVNACASTQP